MAVKTLNDCNAVMRLIDWVNDLALGVKTYTSSQVRTSNTVGIGCNLRWDLLVKLLSGGVTIDVFLSDGITPPNLGGSPDFTTGAISDTADHHLDFATNDAQHYVTLRVTDAGAGSVFAKNTLQAKDAMQVVHGVPQGYHEAVGAFAKVPVTTAYVPLSYASV